MMFNQNLPEKEGVIDFPFIFLLMTSVFRTSTITLFRGRFKFATGLIHVAHREDGFLPVDRRTMCDPHFCIRL